MARKRETPEERAERLRLMAESAEARKELEASPARYELRVREWREREERRHRLLRWVFPFRRAA